MSHQWEKRQVASNSKINVSAWPALCRPCWKGSQSAERLNPPWGSKRFDFILLPLQMITDRKGNRKLNMAENTEEKRKKNYQTRIISAWLTVWTITAFRLAVKPGFSCICYVTRLKVALISPSPSPSSLGTELILQINLSRHTRLHPRQTRGSNSVHSHRRT